ncbi:MAG: MFS transporter [Leptolyngbyaceae bacterium]|nr:MFS transporter [Leptolyngbyaceae bacterium]
MGQSTSSARVLWMRVWGLAAVQGAISLTWVIYILYLDKLLIQYGFSAEFAAGLLIVENVLAAIMEPLMGTLSDRFQHWLGSRFPFIAVGLIAASACFVAVPVVLAFGSPSGIMRWLLPTAMVLWALAQTVFRSPAMSLLGRYAYATNLPRAASILTLMSSMISPLRTFATDLILQIGPLFAFSIGSISLLVAATALGMVGPDQGLAAAHAFQENRRSTLSASLLKLVLVFGTGIGTTMGFQFIMQALPNSLTDGALIGSKGLIGAISAALIVTALPAGELATRLGNRRGIVVGLVGLVAACGLLAIAQQQTIGVLALAIALGAAVSLVSNTSVPFALSMVSPQRAGLGTGIFFSGAAVGFTLFVKIKPAVTELPAMAALGGAAVYGLAAVCVMLSTRWSD